MLKKLAFLIIAILSFSYLMGLTAGDIAILGLNTDATKSMIFVALIDIPANTTISFTDNGWNAATESWRAKEGTISWSHTQSISKGTCITINNLNLATISTTTGTVSRSGNFDPSASGDQILAYEGTTAPTSNDASTWLYGFSIENWSWNNNSNTSDLPTALIGASVGLTNSATEVDNGYFANGDTAQSEVSVSGTKSQLLALFTDSSKYYKDDAGPLTFPTYNISEQPPLPVVLTSFTATISNQNYINLTWITQSETGMMGYYVMRSTQNDLSTAKVVSPLIPATNTSQPKAYLYTDTEVTESGTYYYWLQCNDYDGIINTYGSISIEYNPGGGNTTPSIPLVTELLPVFPNPFNPQLFIPFNLANKLEVKIIIYNTRGQIVKEIPVGEQNPGNYRIEWDGKDSKGQALPTGIYCIRMIAGKDYYQTKAILMK